MSRHEKLLKIIKNYGVIPQLKYLFTELFELTEAIIAGDKKHITEEFADVMVMLTQFKVYFDLDTREIDSIMTYKIDRQLKRIDEEVNENEAN